MKINSALLTTTVALWRGALGFVDALPGQHDYTGGRGGETEAYGPAAASSEQSGLRGRNADVGGNDIPARFSSPGALGAGQGSGNDFNDRWSSGSDLIRRDENLLTFFVVDSCSVCLENNPLNPSNCDPICMTQPGLIPNNCMTCLFGNPSATQICDSMCFPWVPNMESCMSCLMENNHHMSACQSTCIQDLTSLEPTDCTMCLSDNPRNPSECLSWCTSWTPPFTPSPCQQCVYDNRDPTVCTGVCQVHPTVCQSCLYNNIGMASNCALDCSDVTLSPCQTCVYENTRDPSVCTGVCNLTPTVCQQCLYNNLGSASSCVGECSDFTPTPCQACLYDNQHKPSNCQGVCMVGTPSVPSPPTGPISASGSRAAAIAAPQGRNAYDPPEDDKEYPDIDCPLCLKENPVHQEVCANVCEVTPCQQCLYGSRPQTCAETCGFEPSDCLLCVKDNPLHTEVCAEYCVDLSDCQECMIDNIRDPKTCADPCGAEAMNTDENPDAGEVGEASASVSGTVAGGRHDEQLTSRCTKCLFENQYHTSACADVCTHMTPCQQCLYDNQVRTSACQGICFIPNGARLEDDPEGDDGEGGEAPDSCSFCLLENPRDPMACAEICGITPCQECLYENGNEPTLCLQPCEVQLDDCQECFVENSFDPSSCADQCGVELSPCQACLADNPRDPAACMESCGVELTPCQECLAENQRNPVACGGICDDENSSRLSKASRVAENDETEGRGPDIEEREGPGEECVQCLSDNQRDPMVCQEICGITPCQECLYENQRNPSTCLDTCEIELADCQVCIANNQLNPSNCMEECEIELSPCQACLVDNQRNPSACMDSCGVELTPCQECLAENPRSPEVCAGTCEKPERDDPPSQVTSSSVQGAGAGRKNEEAITPCAMCFKYPQKEMDFCENVCLSGATVSTFLSPCAECLIENPRHPAACQADCM